MNMSTKTRMKKSYVCIYILFLSDDISLYVSSNCFLGVAASLIRARAVRIQRYDRLRMRWSRRLNLYQIRWRSRFLSSASII